MAGVGQVWRRWRLRRRRVEYIAQIEVTECGAACLAMVMAFHDHHVPLAQVREACDVSRDGINAYDLLQAARRYGFQARAVQLEDMAQLAQLPAPAILHWDFNHFVVLERVAGGRVVIVDPALGRVSVSLAEAGRRFTGVVLLFAPQPQLVRRPRERPSLAKYKTILLQQWPGLALLLLASLGLQLIGLALPAANQVLIDRVIQPQQPAWLWGLGLGLGAAVLGRLLLSLSRSWVLQGLQNALDAGLMQRFLDHLLHLPLAFFLQRQTGDLVQRVQSNTALRNLFSSQSLSALLDAALLSGYVALMLAYEWRLGLVVSVFGALRVLQLLALRRRNQRIMATELARGGGELGALVEALSGLETSKAAGAEDRLVERWSRHLVASLNSNLQRRYVAINADQLMIVLQGASLAAVFLIGGRAVLEQQMTLGVFAAFLALQALYLEPLESLVRAALQLQFLGNHLRRLDDVLDTPAEPRGGVDPGRLRGEISLEDVSLRYGARAPFVLKNISLRIAPGEKIALVGRSGAGKSSLARLLLGMHTPTSGVVRFDGHDLASLDLAGLRRQMGVVLQETFLFDDTVRANLSLNDDSLPLPRLAAAAQAACLDATIEALPEGYYTRLGENGCRLSGGQRQRLSLARALAHDPAVLLLDEATSALDLPTEARVHAHLAALGCTRIVIAHRLDTVRDADRILVLEQGEIVQQGTFEQLCNVDGLFRRLAESLPAFAPEPAHG